MIFVVLQYEWIVQSHTVNLVRALAAKGHQVDFYIKGCDTSLVNLNSLNQVQRVKVLDMTVLCRTNVPAIDRLLRMFWSACDLTAQLFCYHPVFKATLFASSRKLRQTPPDCLIGIEKKGMIWASLLSKLLDVPFIYFSLELYDDTHPYYQNTLHYRELRIIESQEHKKAAATIVQDTLRGNHLLASNGVCKQESKIILLPISVPGDVIKTKGHFFYERFDIPVDRPIILYLGLLEEARHTLSIAQIAKSYSDRFTFVCHGYGDKQFLKRLYEESDGRLVISTEMVPEAQIPELVSSVDIGLALYRRDCANDLLTAFSSEKVALYCRSCVPFLAFATESYDFLFSQCPCGVVINDTSEIPKAAAKIINDYQHYSDGAEYAFNKYFRHENNMESVVAHISEICGKQIRLHE